ncbi:hypothetical protein H1D32_10045 [Anaerobacillus sp. CMMVII]|uniref:lysine 5,6-aminomutase reactivase subunit KamB n=1 Tax=Anaerobacillus sp. CMMVII TaxID=2755588 RepID=UPI0021B82888|nr:hypothetical protein [Anaerobacillus sp. CMMVII]MCT8138069.1 hypothetical protein [Anaerobacillus sp. CMMVII]
MCKATSVIGLSKNAGKTTLLNHLINVHTNIHQKKIGLTSIGVDGEKRDVWTGHEKPEIFIPEGTIVATTNEGLKSGSAKWRILEGLHLSTSAGKIYVAEAVSSGSVKIIGIPIVDNLLDVIKAFKSYHVNEILIDGAYDRLSSANPYLTNQTYLTIGASLSQQEATFWSLVYERLYPFFYPTIENKEINDALMKNNEIILIKRKNTWIEYPSVFLHTFDEHYSDEIDWMIIPGILTEQMLTRLLKYKKAWNIVLQHGLKSFVSSSTVRRWTQRGGGDLCYEKN